MTSIPGHAHDHASHDERSTEQLLVAHDLRVTSQRVIVLDAMRAEHNDITAQSLHERLRPSHPKLGLATVYRTLNALAEAGILDQLHHGHDGACFRYCAPGHHHHLTCRTCHRVVELRDCELNAWTDKIGASLGFADIEHRVELEGTCDNCRAETT